MFGLFKKTHASTGGEGNRVVGLLQIFESFSNEITEIYSDVERHNPAELRLFTMSAISIYVQSYGNLPEKEMQRVVEAFVEQAIAALLFKMPKVSYERVHSAFVERFGEYADIIVNVTNASTSPEVQSSTMSLMTAIDKNLGVQRGAFEAAVSGLKLLMPLTNCAADVRDACKIA